MDSGYKSVGDSIEFIFGQQKTIVIGREVITLKDRFNEIKGVNIAGDFNNWNPKDVKYVAVMGSDKIFRLKIDKKQIGKKGETRQFKFVINHEYWVEPPKEAVNQFTGKDGYTNLTLKL
jgi:stalled ribosome alternative rescue factor ArfA